MKRAKTAVFGLVVGLLIGFLIMGNGGVNHVLGKIVFAVTGAMVALLLDQIGRMAKE